MHTLFFSLWPDGGAQPSVAAGLQRLNEEPAVRDELRFVMEVAFTKARHVTVELTGPLQDVPLGFTGAISAKRRWPPWGMPA